jgi:hypothetical protein
VALALFLAGLVYTAIGDVPSDIAVPVPTQLFQGSLLLGSIAKAVRPLLSPELPWQSCFLPLARPQTKALQATWGGTNSDPACLMCISRLAADQRCAWGLRSVIGAF